MYDYLSGYKLSEGEKEKILTSCLKGMRSVLRRQPVWLRKRKNKHVFDRIDKIYGEKCTSAALRLLKDDGFLGVDDKSNKYIVTAKGRVAIRRGWVYKNLLWYNTGKANKYAIIISIIAILLTAAQLAYLLLSGATG